MSEGIRQQALAAARDTSLPRIATISSYDGKGSVKVNIQPQNIESGWMPLGAIGVGNGWGVSVGPQIGDQVMVVFAHGDFTSGTIVARIHSVVAQPMPVPTGEIWAVHATTTSIKFLTNGDLDMTTAGNLNATVAGNLTANVTGTASIYAAIVNIGGAVETLRKLVTDAMVAFFNSHTHTSQSPGTPTSVPNQTMGSAELTSVLNAG